MHKPSVDDFFFFFSLSSSAVTAFVSPRADVHDPIQETWFINFRISLLLMKQKKIENVMNLRFRNVNAATNKMLKRRENPNSAPIHIQNQYSSVKNPLDLRRTFPTVGALILGSVFGCRSS